MHNKKLAFTLAESTTHVDNSKNPRKPAFTLAEVLIVLAIIGIIAVMVLPGISSKYRRTYYSMKLQKFVTSMNQVSRMIRADNGEYLAFTGLNYNKNTQAQFQKARYEEVQRYFAPYLKHNKIIKKDAGARMYLSDGGEIQVQGGSCFDITYDINGSQKPNKYGIDKYLFIMCGAENIRFYWQGSFPTKPKTRAEFVQKCKTATSAQYYYCIGLLELDKWKIYEDNTWNFK